MHLQAVDQQHHEHHTKFFCQRQAIPSRQCPMPRILLGGCWKRQACRWQLQYWNCKSGCLLPEWSTAVLQASVRSATWHTCGFPDPRPFSPLHLASFIRQNTSSVPPLLLIHTQALPSVIQAQQAFEVWTSMLSTICRAASPGH